METEAQPQHIQSPQEYIVEMIVPRIGKPPNIQYIERCYGYVASDDVVDPFGEPPRTLSQDISAQLPKNLIHSAL